MLTNCLLRALSGDPDQRSLPQPSPPAVVSATATFQLSDTVVVG